MKALAITLGLLLASTVALAGHGEGKQGGDRAEHWARMQQELGLSDEQKEQIREIREQGGSREEIHSVLTEEQLSKMQEMRESHKGEREERMARMQKHLDLSDDQMEQIRQIREQGGSREEIHAVLTDEQRAKIEERRKNHDRGDGPQKSEG